MARGDTLAWPVVWPPLWNGLYADLSGAQFGEPTLILDGREVLWWVSQATSEAIRALLQVATHALHQSRDS